MPSAPDTLPDDRPLRVADEVVSRVLDGEAMILDLRSGTYFGLNAVGTRIWELIGRGATPRQIRATLCDEFEVDEPSASRDLTELLATLCRKGLLVTEA